MMDQDDLKKYSVTIGDGSGCFFQPMTDKETYILTAKHLFFVEEETGRKKIKKELSDGTVMLIQRMIKKSDIWIEETVPFILNKNINYFPHQYADVAILKIEFIPEIDNIFIQETFSNDNGFNLCGFPANSRINPIGEKYTSYSVEKFLASGNYCHGAQLYGGLNQTNIEGMSGCGILKIYDNHICIIGVQSKMASSLFPMGQIGFVPFKYFNEIIDYEENIGKLEKLLPNYLTSFTFLSSDIFQLQTGVLVENKSDALTQILKAKAIEIQNSNITPIYISEHIKSKLYLLSKEPKIESQKRKIWALWLELLTILNVSKNRSHTIEDLPNIFKKVRFFYSNIDEDFWLKHLSDLPKLDYSGLDNDAIIVVASNVQAQDNFHVLDLSKILPNISQIRKDYDLKKIAGQIDNGHDFPLEKWKFMNLSAFKEKTVQEVSEEFTNQKIANCLINIKSLYEQLIPNW